MVLSMRFFKEFHGFFFEFNSLGDYFKFLLGRLVGAIIGLGILALMAYFLFLWADLMLNPDEEDEPIKPMDELIANARIDAETFYGEG